MKDRNQNMQKQKKHSSARYTWLSILSVVIFLIVWQTVVQLLKIPENKVPSPVKVLEAFVFKITNRGPDGSILIVNVLTSLQVALSGLAAAIGIGIPLGILMGWYKLFERIVKIIFEIVRPMPPIAWIPLVILWFGVGLGAKTVIIFLSAFVPCVLNSYTGIRQTNKTLIDVAKTFGASDFYIFVHVGLPSSVPMVFAGMRVALSNAWSTLVAAEMVAASAGLGYMINMARNFGRIDVVIVGMICIGAFGAVFTWLFGKLESKVLKGRAFTNG